ncbi:hypothetical protein LTR56_014345 [Elasticomyces elasticus]|nr:hypothetical protein LTR56_014345 [Elasticomyces elasticus]
MSVEAPIQSFVFEATTRACASFDALTQAQGLQGDDDNSQTLHIAIIDNSSRFNIWVGNIGARYPADDQRSADHRLRDAPRPASRILILLQDLCEVNHELLEILLGHRQDAADVDAEHAGNVSDYDEAFDLEGGENPISEAHELCLTVGNLITSLMKVSILIRKATPRDKYAKAAAKKAMPEWTPSDRSHVGDKFPKVKDQRWLVERLGDAITARRQFLRYSQEHHERLAGDSGGKHDVSGRSAPNAAVTATAASTLDFEMIQSRNLHQLKDDDDSYSQAYSRVTYAAAVDSPLKFSSLESVAKGDSTFECPYCWSIVTCKKQREWEVHMLEDLRAYVCTFEGCKIGPFETRGSWFGHELEVHRRQWHCPSCPGSNSLYHSADQLESHLLSHHADRFPLAVVRSIVDGNSTPITEYSVHDACAFCNDLLPSTSHHTASGDRKQVKVISVTKLKEHIATHLEQLALFALPPTDENIDDTDEDEDAIRDTTPLPQQHAWQQNVLSEEIDTVGQTSISDWAPPIDLEAQAHLEPNTSTFHLPGDERVHVVGRDEPATWFYSQTANRKYRWSKSKNAYVWDDGTMVAQQQPPAPSRPSTGARPAATPTPILIDGLDRRRPLDPMARLDFFDVHNFDTSLHNTRLYGNVNRDSQLPLRTQYMAVQASTNRSTAQQGRPSVPPGPPPGLSPGVPPPWSAQGPGRGYVERPTQQSRQTSAPTTVDSVTTAVHSNAAIPVNVLLTYLNNLHQTVTARGLNPPQALTQMQLQHFAANSTDRAEYLSRLRSNWERATDPRGGGSDRRN